MLWLGLYVLIDNNLITLDDNDDVDDDDDHDDDDDDDDDDDYDSFLFCGWIDEWMVMHCSVRMDEIWVPTDWHKELFSRYVGRDHFVVVMVMIVIMNW